eukprot:gnl/Hemi2/14187_TR4813_c0_g1_i1.p1 gnl/Hemi2/14187_TR4813_c0_g1~~gnl/Hemi2/14187_TR4813_c0_g1_i1.p1  ORF type:complete len:490 (-),score=101.78 gnl/Hemi2/14187_TR4813_c0_g1_i1:123-1592(-)
MHEDADECEAGTLHRTDSENAIFSEKSSLLLNGSPASAASNTNGHLPPSSKPRDDDPDPPCYVPRRVVMMFLCFLASFLAYVLRLAMSLAIVPMSEQFGWTQIEKGALLAGFFVGYLVTLVPGGILALRLGAKTVLAVGLLGSCVFNALTPFVAEYFFAVFLMRSLVGFFQGVVFPAVHHVISRWIPATEHARANSTITCGTYLGGMLAFGGSAAYMKHVGSWPMVFILPAAAGLVWVVLWAWLSAETPAQHATISSRELAFITNHLKHKNRVCVEDDAMAAVPWARILVAAPIWAIMLNQFAHHWFLYSSFSWLPSFYKSSLGFDVHTAGILIMFALLMMLLTTILTGTIADLLRATECCDVVWIRRIFQTLGCLLPSAFILILIGVLDDVPAPLAIILITSAMSCSTLCLSGAAVNHLDISPRYASVIYSLIAFSGNFGAMLGTFITGVILHATGDSWAAVFIVYIALFFFAALVFNLCSVAHVVFE